jgi:hypothetical protein
MAEQNLRLVYGAGNVGLMGLVADAVLAEGGEVVGVIPASMVELEVAHDRLTERHVVETMHQRKAMMADRADGFLALPGGIGTFEEWFEILTWSQLGYHRKPVGLVNVGGFFDPLTTLLDHAVEQRFVKPKNRDLWFSAPDPASALQALREWTPPAQPPKVDPDELRL